jgi:hypothetical protein
MSSKKKTPAPVPKSISDAIRNAGPKPPDTESRTVKKNYAERLSNEVARHLAMRLRELGLDGCQPDEEGGRERQFAGGIGAKKVDVSFATEEDGLVLAVSVKSICFRDQRTQNFQKNLTNRRGDLLSEATTLHQRFPYAVIGGLFLFDHGAKEDGTSNRVSTFITAHEYFRAFNNRTTQANAVQKFEELGIATYQSEEPFEVRFYDSGKPDVSDSIENFFSRLLEGVAERNPDRFRFSDGKLKRRRLAPLPDHQLTGEDESE